MGGAKACQQCRHAKRRCRGSQPFTACTACLKRRISCSRQSTGRDPQLIPVLMSVPISQQVRDGISLPRDITIELVEHYIDKIHDRPHSLFHIPTLRDSVSSGKISDALLLSICSMGSRFSKRPETRLLEQPLTATAKRLILASIEDMTLENIQTCILVANLCAAEAKPISETLFFRIAINMAQIMRLTSFHRDDTLIMREVKRRVWWTLVMADRWSSSGLGLSRHIVDFERPVDLPMDESMFYDITSEHQSLDRPWKPGLWAHMMTLVDLFGPIQHLNRRIVHEDLEESEIDSRVDDLCHKLDAWEHMLPENARMNKQNLALHKTMNTGGPFIALHLGFHHYSTLLYFQYLEARRTREDIARSYAERCKYHASSYSALLELAREQDGFAAAYPTVGHMCIVSSSVLVHILLFDDESKIANARSSLNANFEALVHLVQYWPNLTSMIDRLIQFQNMCLLSVSKQAHALNRWMIRFLIEHALPLEERACRVVTLTNSDEMNIISTETLKLSHQGRFTTFPIADVNQALD